MSDETKSLTPSPTSQEERLECVLAEYLRLVEQGSEVDHQAILSANPDLADDLREFFANQARMQKLVRAGSARTGGNGSPPRKIKYFGDYEILEEIAHGGMGVVYKARQTSLNRIVAVKMILAGQLANESDVKRFQAEAEAAANLHHPGIVAIYEVGVQDGQHYYSMEYIDGQNLAQIVREKPLSITKAADYVRDIATVLEYAHGRKVLHRDLKPSNLLLDASGRLRITDFGLAKRVEGESDLTMTGQVLGTPSYMSPEQAAAQHAIIGPPTDIYALGAILYELVTGRPPFRSENIGEILRQVQHDEPVRPRLLNSKLPRDLETICLKCLEKEPRRRYASAKELAEELGHYLRGEPIRARRIGPLSRGFRWCRRNPAVSGLCTAVAALVLVVGVAMPVGIALAKRAREEEQKRLKLEDNLLVNQADELSAGLEPDFVQAELKLTAAIERRPKDAGLYAKRARVRFEMEHNVEALEDGQRARELGLDSEEMELLMLLAARDLGQKELASSQAEVLLERAPESIESILAHVFTTIPNAQSLEKLDKAFLTRPFDSRLLSIRGQANLHILQYQGDKKVYDQAVSDLVRALQSRPFDLRARQSLCLCHLQYYFLADLNQRPLASAKELLDAWPAAEADWRRDALFALWRLKGEEFAKAAEICQAAAERFPNRPEFAHVLGQALYRKKEYVAADDAFARCEALFAKQPVTLWPLSHLQLTAQRALCGAGLKAHDEWRSRLVKALEEPEFERWTPDEWTYHDWHAVVHAHVPLKPKETGGWCTRWAKAAPGCPSPHCVEIPGLKNERKSLDTALQLAPSHRSARLARARIYEAERQFAAAIADCEIYLQFKPDSSAALLVQARALSEAGPSQNLRRARAVAFRLVELEPKDPEAWDVLARVDTREQNYQPALAALEKACEFAPANMDYQIKKGRVLMERGATERALRHVDSLVSAHPATYERLRDFAEILSIPPSADVRCGERAVELVRQALELVPLQLPANQKHNEINVQRSIRRSLAFGLYRANRWEEVLQESFEEPDNLRELFRAMAVFRLGRESEARSAYDKAAEQAGADLVGFDPHQRDRAAVRREAAHLLGYHFDQTAKAQDVARHGVRPGDCPQLGGWGARNNVSESTLIPETWNPGKFDRKTGDWIRDTSKNIKWMAKLGNLTYGNPVVANGNVLVGTSNTSGYLKRYPSDVDLGCVLCFRESDGAFRWQYSSEKLPTGRMHDWPMLGICSSPLIEGERAWFVSNRGVVVCVDTAGFWDDEDDGQPIEPIKENLFHVPAYCRDVLGQRPVHPVLRERLEALGIKIKDEELGGFSAVQMRDEKAAASLPAGEQPPWVVRLTWQKKTDAGTRDWLRFHVAGDQLLIEELGPTLGQSPVQRGSILDPLWAGHGTPDVIAALGKEFARAGLTLPADLNVRTEREGVRWSFELPVADGVETYVVRLTTSYYAERLRPFRPEDKFEADVVWELDMMKELGISQHNMCTCPPASWGNLVFVCTSNGVDESHKTIPSPQAPSFIALDKQTGKILWTDNSPGANIHHGQWSGPAVGVLGGVPQVIFPGGDGWVYSFHAEKHSDGKPELLWKFDVNPKDAQLEIGGRGTRNEVIAVPVIYDGRVYVSSGQDPEHGEGQGQLWCLDPTKRGDISRQLVVDIKDRNRVIPHRREKAIIPQNGEILIDNPNSGVVWLYDRIPPARGQKGDSFYDTYHRSLSSVAIKDDLLVAADFSGLIHCLNAKTGKLLWQHDPLASIWSSPLIVGSRIFVTDEDGDVVVLPLTPFPVRKPVGPEPDDLIEVEPLAEINMPNSINCTPFVAQDVLYIATRDRLYAIAAERNPQRETAP